jgi:membrane fusion protein, copper/silver efflux system
MDPMDPTTPTSDSSRAPRGRSRPALVVVALLAGVALGGAGVLVAQRGARGDRHADGAAHVTRYQCPMHPSVVQDHPGDCPICGMKLVAMDAAPPATTGATGGPAKADAAAKKWVCPMHPSVVRDGPGKCPICGMDLVPADGGGERGAASKSEGLATVTIDPARQQLIGLRTASAERGAVGGAWRTVGRVAVDERRVHHVNVKVGGFIEHDHASFVGKAVKAGEPLFSLYSPELLAAQEEYLLALRTRRSLSGAGAGGATGDALVDAAREKLQLWDVPASEIVRLERTGKASKNLMFYSPATGVIAKRDVVPGMRVNAGDMPYEIQDLSRVWVLADVYESELRHIRVGMPARLTLRAYPDRTFRGRVAFVDPALDPKTRTVKVRLEFPNPDGQLKPEMFGEVVLEGAAREALRVPADAVIDSGTRHVVFVALGEGKFEPRDVGVGDQDGQHVEIVSGLADGDEVVTRANFLVDSESRLKASLAAIGAAPAARPPAASKEHSGHAPEAAAAPRETR